ncbi:hypothetical protein B8X02_17985 [Stenotrophomonas rhizophila]|jgi:hypothetical protein|uniref:hypothetical protein n=1 Tax=Stenotrophomonas TaxID=40323 RepID=UPI000BA5B875|nr:MULTISPECIES: hypothetical protein [Stenotrophomonas]MDQ1063785.1 hypothetical protein [Stenotrophomonas sp. SORGH_AS_0282]MDQ1187848.1 hypothetical protein [Stenotrophomonas sp. SORGH_AS_0282]PAK89213.1 hypothetical protein B8X02_17985 [Stenotrophomonas rhizophila]UQY88400.1 hypothetical protein LQE85_03970 [Stenotrophomonas rhizophila]
MSIAEVLNQLFRPASFNAEKTVRAIVAHPEAAARDFNGLITHINNRCHQYGIGCRGEDGLRAQVNLDKFARSKGAAAPTEGQAKLLLNSLKSLQRDLERQRGPARLASGAHDSWNNDRLNQLNKALELTRSLQHFRGPARG